MLDQAVDVAFQAREAVDAGAVHVVIVVVEPVIDFRELVFREEGFLLGHRDVGDRL